MWCFIIVLVLVPSLLAARVKENHNGNPIVCANPEAINMGNKFFSCFDLMVQNIVKNENKSCPTRLFPQSSYYYLDVANKTCYNDTISRERDALEFYKLVTFSMKSAFKDFVDLGGAECIHAIKHKVTKCVTETIGRVRGANNKYHVLWKASALDYDVKSCRDTNRIKNCTLHAMRTEGYYKCKYETSLVLYVDSLFDYMLERCTRIVPTWVQPTCSSEKDNGSRTTHILLGLLLMLACLGIMYVLFRYYRLRSGGFRGWKLFT